MLDNSLADSFNWALRRPLKQSGIHADIIRVPGAISLPDVSEYSHVLISGSEASVLDEQSWDIMLKRVVKDCVNQEKPLMGICYGHQFVAHALMTNGNGNGKGYTPLCVTRSTVPEFGWERIKLIPNRLFNGIDDPVCMVSHYDTVTGLNDDFKLLASTPNCMVHAFQYKDLPIWGVQFHPEYNEEEADEIFDKLAMKDPDFSAYLCSKLVPEARLKDNERIILNFLAISG